MNFGRIAAAAVIAWIVSLGVGYLVNNVILYNMYAANAAAFRPEAVMMPMLPIGFGVQLLGFFAFAYMFAKGYEGGSGIAEGARFGVLVAIMIDCFAIVWNYVTLPISGTLALAMMTDYLIEAVIYGVIVGAIYKPTGATARRAAAV